MFQLYVCINLSLIAAAVDERPIKKVRTHLQRRKHPANGLGKWIPGDDQLLLKYVFCYCQFSYSVWLSPRGRAVEDLGQNWPKVSQRVGRSLNDCRDRYRNHLADKHTRNTGECLSYLC